MCVTNNRGFIVKESSHVVTKIKQQGSEPLFTLL